MDTSNAHPKYCFIISPIGDEGSPIRKRADQVLKHVITPAVTQFGYTAVRADKLPEPGMITSQVIQRIIDDPLVIADLTGANANVYYELALRHAVRKPFVQIIQKGEKLPFDIAGMRTIPVDLTDPDSVEEARGEIAKQIESSKDKRPDQIDTPVSVSIELQQLRQSDNLEERSLAQVISAVAGIRNDIATLDGRLSSFHQTSVISIEARERLTAVRTRQAEALRSLERTIAELGESIDATFLKHLRGEQVPQLDRTISLIMDQVQRVRAIALELELIATQFVRL